MKRAAFGARLGKRGFSASAFEQGGAPSLSWVNPRPIRSAATPLSQRSSGYLAQVLTSQVYEAALETPLTYAHTSSTKFGHNVYLKREDTQPVFSFKIRGAYNKIASLTLDERKKGVVTCSAGNHAQGVALSAAKLGIEAIIVMPLATPAIKINAVRRLGGPTVTVKLHGQNFDAAAAEARRLVIERGLTMIHPFDDPHVIAGQGTIGMEILKILNGKPLDAVFCCVGGGGLLAGVAAVVKALRPECRVIGVEADDAAGMTASLLAGKVVTLPHVGLFADGAAVRTVGQETFAVCQELVDEMITVSTDQICSAIKLGFNDTRCVLEPAGALAVAGLDKFVKRQAALRASSSSSSSPSSSCSSSSSSLSSVQARADIINTSNQPSHTRPPPQTPTHQSLTLVAVCSGANMDFDRLRFVSERADSSETLMSVAIPERPGSFRELYSMIHPRNVTEFSYRCNGSLQANVFVSFQSTAGAVLEVDKEVLAEALRSRGYGVTDLGDNEMAKAHARHLAGGRGPGPLPSHTQELVYRFEFPEAPGALDKFLHTLNHFNQGWSISLFHYRNHGHDFGRVLVGLLVEDRNSEAFASFLDNLGYTYVDETENAAYKQFLK